MDVRLSNVCCYEILRSQSLIHIAQTLSPEDDSSLLLKRWALRGLIDGIPPIA